MKKSAKPKAPPRHSKKGMVWPPPHVPLPDGAGAADGMQPVTLLSDAKSNKPQLIIQDFGGAHNKDLSKARGRLVRGGSWKKQRIVVIMPSAETIAAKVALSQRMLAFPPNNGVTWMLALGQEVGEAYSNALEMVLADRNLSKWEYVLTIEHDNMPPPDGVIRLVEQMEQHPEYSCIGGAYWTTGPEGVLQAWGDPKDAVINFRPQLPDPGGGLVECCGTGMGFNLFRLSMFKDKKLRRPWFKTQTSGGVCTQDLYFWSDARQKGNYRCAIDCSVRVGHHDLTGERGGIPDYVW